ncbi:MAG: hypothetical protein ACI8TE_001008, partial [Francisella sp.]
KHIIIAHLISVIMLEKCYYKQLRGLEYKYIYNWY